MFRNDLFRRSLSLPNVIINDQGSWKQIKFPRSNKSRIRKKWSKLTERNKRLYHKFCPIIQDGSVIVSGNMMVMNRATFFMMESALREKNDE
jgi:hypothetical protein